MADCAVFILWDKNTGKALMEDRPDLKPGSDHYWVYPGGKVEEGESWLDAAYRECMEETGLKPIDYDFVHDPYNEPMRSRPAPGTVQYTKSPEGWQAIGVVITAWEGDVPERTLDDHHAALRWVYPHEIAAQQPNGYTCNVQVARYLLAWATAKEPTP
jgi:8-oxo-dGTP pyrophosphatase MutT (NUDIX family)